MNTQQQETVQETVIPLTSEYPVARVDLLPPEILDRRRFRKAQAWMVVGLVGLVAGLGTGYYLAYADAQQAVDELAVEQQRTTVLQAEAAQFAQVPAILASVDRAESALATAMAPDIEWYRYLSQVGESAPEGVWFRSIATTSLAPGGAGVDPLAPVDSVAELSTTGRALSSPGVAAWLDSMDSIANLDYGLFSDVRRNDDTGDQAWVDFTTSIKVAPEAYSNRYAQEGQ